MFGDREWLGKEEFLGHGDERDGGFASAVLRLHDRKTSTPLLIYRSSWWHTVPAPMNSKDTSFFLLFCSPMCDKTVLYDYSKNPRKIVILRIGKI